MTEPSQSERHSGDHSDWPGEPEMRPTSSRVDRVLPAEYTLEEAQRLTYWSALAEISDLFDGGGWEDADADELRADVERVIGIVSGVLPRGEIEAAQEATDAG